MRYRPRGYTRAICPYYQTDSRKTISCAGSGGADRLRMEFESEGSKNQYMEKHCFCYKSACPWRAVMEKEK